jgi:hypothetical protein
VLSRATNLSDDLTKGVEEPILTDLDQSSIGLVANIVKKKSKGKEIRLVVRWRSRIKKLNRCKKWNALFGIVMDLGMQ